MFEVLYLFVEIAKGENRMITEHEIFELRQQIGKLERQVAFLLEHLDLEYREEANAEVSPEILELVRRGKTISAIKLYREEMGCGLKTAKEFIDSIKV